MNRTLAISLAAFLLLPLAACRGDERSTCSPTVDRVKPMRAIDVFYKERPPSLKTLERVKPVLEEHAGGCDVRYHVITESEAAGLIRKFGLPETHFPFAVVIDGIRSARIGGEVVHFVEFPLFMKGIGRHEGSWSLDHLRAVLGDPALLLEENPPLPHGDEDHSGSGDPCEQD